MHVTADRNFTKLFNKAPKAIQDAFHERLQFFLKNPFHPLIHNHQLKGKYTGARSININGDWRAIYKETDKDTVIFISLGTHSQLYK